MFSCKTYSFVLIFLLASKTVHTFILLTANVEDIKKMAKKFVSDELADKLANTIVKIIERMNGKEGIEEELNKQEYATEKDLIQGMIAPYFQTSKGAQRFQKATRKEHPLERENRQFDNGNEMIKGRESRTTKKLLRNWELNRDHSISPNEQQRYPEIRPNHPHKERFDDSVPRKTFYQMKANQHSNKYHSGEVKSQYVPNLKPIINQDLIESNPGLFVKKSSQDQRVKKSHNRKPAYDIDPGSARHPYESHMIESDSPRRHKADFDQYVDNFAKAINDDYQKMDALATSGDLGLTKLKEKQWWEKELQGTTKVNNWL